MIDAELRDYSIKHLYYEIWSLHETASRLLHDDGLHRDRVLKNSVIDAFTLHARALTTFLHPTAAARRADDVVSDQYVVDAARWAEARGDIPDTLSTVMRCTAKEIAHLTTVRIEYNDPGTRNRLCSRSSTRSTGR